ncbi:polysaccharide deacetylase family protein [Agromyces aurantiacus]|uniref:Polysaccharide deacetylase family protein n=1 Tax=Agromyces aurantiacus TaxID=165814 RepID=A0ABV9R2A3_9MICO|nr:polysaccharide deacetylase family protein [Agromyces aurantiacus]MBM7502643.1 peptidoglycan/xylan/chitin deacetylase (PgdA/CDA1 family) [Agromyces aurantiacus]
MRPARGGRRRVRWLVPVAVAAALGTAACTAGPEAPVPGTATPSASRARPVPALATPVVVAGPPHLGPDRTAGLVPRLAAMRTDAFAVSARWATPPGATEFGDALSSRVAEAVRSYADEHGAAWRPGVDLVAGGVGGPCWGGSLLSVPPASLTVDCAVVTTAGPLVGERVVVTRREAGVATSISRETWYSDAATGAVFDGSALYATGQEARVLALVAEGLRASGRIAPGVDPFAGADAGAVHAVLADSAVTPSGVVVTVPVAGEVPVSVHVPQRLLDPLLSEEGRRAIEVAAGGAPYDPGASPAGADPVDCTLVACVSISFDDGPSSLTPGLLDVLDRERAPATFYVLGPAVNSSPDVARRIVDSGHAIGDHTWRHADLTKLPDDQVRREVSRTQAAIDAATGAPATSLRPPYGASDERVRKLVGLPVVVWDVDTRDWEEPGVDTVVQRAVGESRPGSVVLMHDTHEPTVEAVPAVVDGLRARGFTLATVPAQFDGELPPAGTLVSHGPR